MIQVEKLRKRYNGNRALEDFSLQVAAGALFGLVGPNGAGKTTLIKILSTLLPMDAGEASVGGYSVRAHPQQVRAVTGYLPDFPGLYQEMRVREYLEFFADAFRLRGSERERAVERGLDECGLRDRQDSYVEELSLGMKQRLSLAKTLLHDPKVLLLDEPATGLDPMARFEFREQMKELHRKEITILISSHILSDLEDICTDVALIAEGRNATTPEGSNVLHLAAAEAVRCEIEVLGEAASAHAVLADAAGVQVVSRQARRITVEVTGGEEALAALLRRLVSAGVAVTRFAPGAPALEQQYRYLFGGGRE